MPALGPTLVAEVRQQAKALLKKCAAHGARCRRRREKTLRATDIVLATPVLRKLLFCAKGRGAAIAAKRALRHRRVGDGVAVAD